MKQLDINLFHKNYPIYIHKGILDSIGEEIKKIYKNKKIAVITDENVEKYYGEIIVNNLGKCGYEVCKVILKPGEKSKSMYTLIEVYNKLLDFNITRGDLIITFGGGVIGDLGGFAASTLFRGIPFIQIPTSLLAQIDSSIGGKVAVDLPRGKNLVGSFYHPEAVFIDPQFLETLDKRFLYDGMGEVIKYGCIRDAELFNMLDEYKNEDELFENIEDIIYRCCSIKKEVVENDEKDTGERMILNFGHTLGHAIERYFDYDKYTHGEAVAAGMYAITKKSEEWGISQEGTSDKLKKILKQYKLPTEVVTEEKHKILETIALDKKNIGKDLNVILIERIGKVIIKRISNKEIEKLI